MGSRDRAVGSAAACGLYRPRFNGTADERPERNGARLVDRVKEINVRLIMAGLTLALGACSIDADGTNEQVTVEYDKQEIREKARTAGRAAREVAAGVGNVAASTGRAISNEVGDIDVDVDVSRNRQTPAEPAQRP